MSDDKSISDELETSAANLNIEEKTDAVSVAKRILGYDENGNPPEPQPSQTSNKKSTRLYRVVFELS